MTQLSAERQRDSEKWRFHEFTGTATKLWKGALLGMIMSGSNAGKVAEMSAVPNLRYLGTCWRTVDCSSADATVTVRLDDDLLDLEWCANGDSITALTDYGKIAYAGDDQTVYKGAGSAAGVAYSPIGRILLVDSTLGVLVEKFVKGFGPQDLPGVGVLAAYTSNDTAPASISNGAIYDVPTTGAASTISLPAATDYRDGHSAKFVADGTKNAHTVTFRDVATAISAALTASKRFCATATVFGAKWYITVTVGP